MRTLLALAVLAGPAAADPAEILSAEATRAGDGWRVAVTLRHADTGWDDYADGWRVEDEGGAVLGTRELLHPHVEEQPFTRSLSGVAIPAGTEAVWIAARTSTDGWTGERLRLALPSD